MRFRLGLDKKIAMMRHASRVVNLLLEWCSSGADMKIAIMRHASRVVNLLSEWRSSGADMIKAWIGSTLAYVLFRLLIEASLMRRYHNK